MKQILSLIAFSSALIIACTGITSCSNKANAPEKQAPAPAKAKAKEDTTDTAGQPEDIFSNKIR